MIKKLACFIVTLPYLLLLSNAYAVDIVNPSLIVENATGTVNSIVLVNINYGIAITDPRKPSVIKFTVNYDPSQLQAGAPLDGATLTGKHIHFAQQPASGKLDVIISPKKQNTSVDDGQILQIPFTIVGLPVDGTTSTTTYVTLTNVEMSDGSAVTPGTINTDGHVTIVWPDTDGDGVPDYLDKFPNNRNEQKDTDNDGVGDNFDTDDDGDGMPDVWELAYGLDPLNGSNKTGDFDNDGITDLEEYQLGLTPNDPDSDHDGMPDGWEHDHGLDPLDPKDGKPSADLDQDYLSNLLEYQIGTLPDNKDSDGDGMPDGWEYFHDLAPTDAADATSDPATAITDPDSDRLVNLEEYKHNSDPHKKDTDGDGVDDGDEVDAGTDPAVNIPAQMLIIQQLLLSD